MNGANLVGAALHQVRFRHCSAPQIQSHLATESVNHRLFLPILTADWIELQNNGFVRSFQIFGRPRYEQKCKRYDAGKGQTGGAIS